MLMMTTSLEASRIIKQKMKQAFELGIKVSKCSIEYFIKSLFGLE